MAGFFLSMVVLSDLWVGDKLVIISSNRLVTFIGVNGQRARVKFGAKILLVKPDNLDIYKETETPETITFEEDKSATLDFHNFPTSLDLHINVLAPHLENQLPVRILSHQIAALDEYLDNAEKKGARIVTIIHGKGTGALRTEVHHILKNRQSVMFFYDSNDGGAAEVHFK